MSYKHDAWAFEGDLYVRGFTDADEAAKFATEKFPGAVVDPAKCLRWKEFGPADGSPLINWMRTVPCPEAFGADYYPDSEYCPGDEYLHTYHYVDAKPNSRGAFPLITWSWNQWEEPSHD